jgi:hypothetical protein
MFQQDQRVVAIQLLQTITVHGLPMLLVIQIFLLRILTILPQLPIQMNFRIDEYLRPEQMESQNYNGHNVFQMLQQRYF